MERPVRERAGAPMHGYTYIRPPGDEGVPLTQLGRCKGTQAGEHKRAEHFERVESACDVDMPIHLQWE